MTRRDASPSDGHADITWKHLFGALDRDGQPLNLQIRRAIVRAVETRVLAAQTRMPSSRRLAELLGIARNTVTTAYAQLIDEGFLVSRERSGIFVASAGRAAAPDPNADRAPHGTDAGDWSRHFEIHPSRLRHIDKPRDWLDHPYPFLFGQFDPGLFPANDWRESVRATSSVEAITGWAGDLVDDDDPDLVEQLRLQVLPRRGIFAAPGEIIVTIGSQQALSMLVQLMVGRDTPVGMENPGYADLRNMLRMTGADLASLTCDHHGVVPDAIFASRRAAFVTVGHQCPTTAVMPLDRRRALLEAAARHDVVLIEDDYEADLTLEGEDEGETELPCLKSMGGDAPVIYVGSFSKALAPGLRIGYIVAPRPVIDELRVLRRVMMRHPPTNNQRSLAMFIALGHYRRHLRRTGAVLLERARMMSNLLSELMPHCRWRRDPGAKSFWIEGPEGLDGRTLTRIAREHGVLIEPGDIYFADPSEGRRFIRLGFTSIATNRIDSGLRRLAALMDEDAASRD